MKKGYEMIVKAIEVTKKYTYDEVKEVISKIPLDKQSFDLWGNSQTSNNSENKGRGGKRESYGIKAIEYKELNDIPKEYFAKDFFTKDGLFDLEKVENKLSAVIGYIQPKTRDDLRSLIIDFLNKEVKIIKVIGN